jgi:hypothetical protein
LPAKAILKPKEAVIVEFGALAALYDLAKRLDLTEHIDRHVPKQGRGPTVGEYLLVAILNRCVAPRSKNAIGKWFQGTLLRRIMDLDSGQLSSQRFWENMDRVTSQAIKSIERDITIQMVRDFDIDLKQVLFDGTNFFTFIDTFNERSTLAQRGKNKEGRRALRIVGLALLVSADFHVPLFHRTYPGNQVDAPTFSSLTEDLVNRYREITDGLSTSPSSSTREITLRTICRRLKKAPIISSVRWFPPSILTCWGFLPGVSSFGRRGIARGAGVSLSKRGFQSTAHRPGYLQREPLRRPIQNAAQRDRQTPNALASNSSINSGGTKKGRFAR